MTCRIARRIVSSSNAPKPFIYPDSPQAFGTRLFRRIASKGTTVVPIPGWCCGEPSKQITSKWPDTVGVVAQVGPGGACRVGWCSGRLTTSFLLSTWSTKGGRP
jgi:hypothetical protein